MQEKDFYRLRSGKLVKINRVIEDILRHQIRLLHIFSSDTYIIPIIEQKPDGWVPANQHFEKKRAQNFKKQQQEERSSRIRLYRNQVEEYGEIIEFIE